MAVAAALVSVLIESTVRLFLVPPVAAPVVPVLDHICDVGGVGDVEDLIVEALLLVPVFGAPLVADDVAAQSLLPWKE